MAADFITTWKTDNPGTSGPNQITIPTNGAGYNYDIDWGDGTVDSGVAGDITHTYAVPGTYTVTIRGDFPQIFFDNLGDKDKILSIEQWGDIAWRAMNRSFYGASNLAINATDAPDLSSVTNMNQTFRLTNFNDDIGHWDVSNVTTMSTLFSDNPNFNQDLSLWMVDNVTNMAAMFFGATSFDGDISTWNTGMVELMSNMFNTASAFNQDISGWDTSMVTTMRNMFVRAEVFDQPIGSWTVDMVMDMQAMFQDASSFNQDISGWDTSMVTTMRNMFARAEVFDQPIGSWTVDMVMDMQAMFQDASSFDQDLDLWVTTNVVNMANMFLRASVFNGDITTWDTQNVETMRLMFSTTDAFNQPIGGWNTGKVEDMSNMFQFATVFNQDIGLWNTSAVVFMQQMFQNAPLFNQEIGSWDTGMVTNMRLMFDDATAFDGDIGAWNTSMVEDMGFMFRDAVSFNQDIGFDAASGSWDTGMVTTMQQMFWRAGLFNQDISGWDTSMVESMNAMFRAAAAFDQNLGGWDVGSLNDATNMFFENELSTANYDSLLIGWDAQTLLSDVRFHGGTSNFCLGEPARANMIAADGWVIVDAGLECPNEPPTDISIDGAGADTVVENAAVGTVIGALTTTDPDAGDTHTYTLGCAVAGADDALFQISGANLQTNTVFDFENPSDANTDGTYEVCVRSTDDGSPSEFFDKLLTITIDNARPDLVIEKTVSNDEAMVGEVVTFSLIVSNPGSDAATDVKVNDIVPLGFTYNPSSIAGGDVRNDGSPAGTGLIWGINTLPAGVTAGTLTFTATVIAP